MTMVYTSFRSFTGGEYDVKTNGVGVGVTVTNAMLRGCSGVNTVLPFAYFFIPTNVTRIKSNTKIKVSGNMTLPIRGVYTIGYFYPILVKYKCIAWFEVLAEQCTMAVQCNFFMKYVAFLRAINVGGNSLIKMVDLKSTFEKSGYLNVSTYIQSGNVIFESKDSPQKIRGNIEAVLSKVFNYESKVVVLTFDQLKKVLEAVPHDWKNGTNLRCYIAFVREPVTSEEVLKEITLTDNVDFATIEKGAVYMSTVMEGLTKSGFTKIIGKKIYKEITMRNYNTAKKTLALME